MKCPVCNVDLMMTERQGVEIDYCSQCRGVWLDRGELDKIIERSYAKVGETELDRSPPANYRKTYDDRGAHREDDDYHKHGKKKYKRRSMLADLFDFGD